MTTGNLGMPHPMETIPLPGRPPTGLGFAPSPFRLQVARKPPVAVKRDALSLESLGSRSERFHHRVATPAYSEAAP